MITECQMKNVQCAIMDTYTRRQTELRNVLIRIVAMKRYRYSQLIRTKKLRGFKPLRKEFIMKCQGCLHLGDKICRWCKTKGDQFYFMTDNTWMIRRLMDVNIQRTKYPTGGFNSPNQ